MCALWDRSVPSQVRTEVTHKECFSFFLKLCVLQTNQNKPNIDCRDCLKLSLFMDTAELFKFKISTSNIYLQWKKISYDECHLLPFCTNQEIVHFISNRTF